MALLLTSVFGVTGCGSDDGEAPVESRIKNSTIDDGRPHTSKQIASYGYDSDTMDDDFSDSDDMIDDDDEYDYEYDDIDDDDLELELLPSDLDDYDDAHEPELLPLNPLDIASLLPRDSDSAWIQNSPSGPGGLNTQNLLDAGHHLGIDTVGSSLRNANRGLRSEPPNPQVQVSPWLQTTICPDVMRRPLDGG